MLPLGNAQYYPSSNLRVLSATTVPDIKGSVLGSHESYQICLNPQSSLSPMALAFPPGFLLMGSWRLYAPLGDFAISLLLLCSRTEF